ncbi:MAG: hypothetical protein A4E53_02439 [Pelotomaculum sp. PtaB.Bin104]|nr:MAG: hypothetical protein A4E53_02439 [Pelotomaculum sp. PtaB.Bin104]
MDISHEKPMETGVMEQEQADIYLVPILFY